MKLSDVADILNLSCSHDAEVTGFAIDSRKLAPGQLFIALKGENFDGHDFIKDAAKAGACAVVAERLIEDAAIEQFHVDSSLHALASLATAHRQNMTCPTIALTGSNGKTTVKEMIAHILPKPSMATVGNLNNHIGAPLSVLKLESQHRYAVFELGASRAGDIAYTVAIVSPQVALVNNIAPAHIEGFGSIEGVAREKGEIYRGLATGGVAVINDDDVYAHYWDDWVADKKIIRFSRTHEANVCARDIHMDESVCASFVLITPEGESKVQLRIPGEHSISNALAAASCCHALGIVNADIVHGLNHFHAVSGRLVFLKGKHSATVVDDTYNANLRSTLAAVDVLVSQRGERILVMGDMGELGNWAKTHHADIGKTAKEKGVDAILTCGQLSVETALAFGEGAKHYANKAELISDLLPRLNSNITVLVKGSRSAKMETIVQELLP